MNLTLADFLQLASVAVVISAVGYGLFRGGYYVFQSKIRRREEYFKSFDTVVASCLRAIRRLSSLRLS